MNNIFIILLIKIDGGTISDEEDSAKQNDQIFYPLGKNNSDRQSGSGSNTSSGSKSEHSGIKSENSGFITSRVSMDQNSIKFESMPKNSSTLDLITNIKPESKLTNDSLWAKMESNHMEIPAVKDEPVVKNEFQKDDAVVILSDDDDDMDCEIIGGSNMTDGGNFQNQSFKIPQPNFNSTMAGPPKTPRLKAIKTAKLEDSINNMSIDEHESVDLSK